MRISSLYGRGVPSLSFEFYPPKTDIAMDSLLSAIDHLDSIAPDFVSMTYGAGGSTRTQSITAASRVMSHMSGEVMSHLTGVCHTHAEIEEIADQLWSRGIVNIMGLRGDRPADSADDDPFASFHFAKELIRFLRSCHDFCIGSGCYPEGHLETPDIRTGIQHLNEKVDSGCEFLITQMFLENDSYFRFVDLARTAGIGVPIIPGIMPVTGFAQLNKFETKFGVRLPTALRERVSAHEGDKVAIEQIGVDWAAYQCQELLAQGAPGLHFYTLNKSHATVEVCEHLGLRGTRGRI
ncbi:MAG: methylenetetrahydrofolate reductase [NAD(P)H] [Fimbriimonas sp.]|nr:methylenetetrahydrofolate reductase [NAD(P)H] [Fimbriimonas sp.]